MNQHFKWTVVFTLILATLWKLLLIESSAIEESVSKINLSALPTFPPLQPLKDDESGKDEKLTARREMIRNMTRSAWQAYRRLAWGGELLGKPLDPNNKTNRIGNVTQYNAGQFIIDSMPTLWIMGLQPEFAQARHWLEYEFNFEAQVRLQFGPNGLFIGQVISYLGSMLSCFALSGDRFYLQKAVEFAIALRKHTKSMYTV